jgi:hypothetical protein
MAAGTLCLALAPMTMAQEESNAIPGASILDMTTTLAVEGEWPGMSILGTRDPDCWWDNGRIDGHDATHSQSLGSVFHARTADDYILEAGKWHLIKTIRVCMAVSVNVALPNIDLEIYDDCNGRPGALRTTLDTTSYQQLAASPFPGFNIWVATYTLDPRPFVRGDLDGCSRIWLSPFGIGTGAYFWPTVGQGVIQGAQGHFKTTDLLGPNDWTPYSDLVNSTECRDFCFEVCGAVCNTIKDQGDYDLAGLDSIKFPNVDIFNAMAADNFQIPNRHAAMRLCRVEGYLATNCDPTRVIATIWTNDCDVPRSVICTLSEPEIIDTGELFDGLPVYCFRFDCPECVLSGGFNYWFSMQAVSGGSIHDRGVFLFKRRTNSCLDIHITDGVYKNPLAGFENFTHVSDSDLEGEPREFAFRVYGFPICPVGDEGTSRLVPGDTNRDGEVNFSDILDVLRNWGNSETAP